MQDNRCPVDSGELVVASSQSTPLLEVAEPAFDHIAAAIVGRVERRWPATTRAAPATMPRLIGRFGNDRSDPASAQQLSIGSGRVRLVASDPVRASAWSSTSDTGNLQVIEQIREGRTVTRLPRRDEHDQWEAVAVDEVVDLRRQPTAGTADRVVRWLDRRIRVIRPIPLCGG